MGWNYVPRRIVPEMRQFGETTPTGGAISQNSSEERTIGTFSHPATTQTQPKMALTRPAKR
jgi:hypothetical protein